MKRALVCGAGGFVAAHLVKKLKGEGYWVRGVDIKEHEFAPTAADDFLLLDLRVEENCQRALSVDDGPFDEVLRPDFFLCFTYLPFPNTELYTMAEQAGLLKPGLASNYGGSQGANVDGVDEEALRATLERARDLQQELAGERARRYPLLFSPS